MSYDMAHKELFLADFANNVVRSISLHDNPSNLSDVYRSIHEKVLSVCHMSDSDTLLFGSVTKDKSWLVSLSRNDDGKWHEVHRVQIEGYANISCALSNSQVLIGENDKKLLQLFQVKSDQHIKNLHRIQLTEEYYWFSATCGNDTLVAMSFRNNKAIEKEVRVYRLLGDRLDELARSTKLKLPNDFLWLADLLIATEDNGKSVAEFEVNGTQLERRRQLIALSDNIWEWRWCTVDDGLAIFDHNSKEIVHYKFGLQGRSYKRALDGELSPQSASAGSKMFKKNIENA